MQPVLRNVTLFSGILGTARTYLPRQSQASIRLLNLGDTVRQYLNPSNTPFPLMRALKQRQVCLLSTQPVTTLNQPSTSSSNNIQAEIDNLMRLGQQDMDLIRLQYDSYKIRFGGYGLQIILTKRTLEDVKVKYATELRKKAELESVVMSEKILTLQVEHLSGMAAYWERKDHDNEIMDYCSLYSLRGIQEGICLCYNHFSRVNRLDILTLPEDQLYSHVVKIPPLYPLLGSILFGTGKRNSPDDLLGFADVAKYLQLLASGDLRNFNLFNCNETLDVLTQSIAWKEKELVENVNCYIRAKTFVGRKPEEYPPGDFLFSTSNPGKKTFQRFIILLLYWINGNFLTKTYRKIFGIISLLCKSLYIHVFITGVAYLGVHTWLF